MLFERALAAAPITLPAHVSLFTGQYPFAHGVRNNGDFALNERVPTLATALHDRGYRTAAFVSAFVLDRRYGLAHGFDAYDDHLDSATAGRGGGGLERRGDRTVTAAGEWLDAHRGETTPFFLWVHLYDPHDPYDPPPPYREAFAERPYDGEIAFDDALIDAVLERLQRMGLLASTLVAVVGDHGESLGEHEEATHSLFVYEATLRVPLILWWPGHVLAGRRVASLVRGIDLAPTLLDLAGVTPLQTAQGETLLPRVRDTASIVAPSAYAETYFPLFYMNWAPLRSIQDERWKLIDAPEPELYDLSRDAQERSNVAAREPSRVAALRRALDALTGGSSGAMSGRVVDADTAAKLAALGYVGAAGSGTATAAAGNSKPDPKRMIGVFNRLREANAAAHAGRDAEAETIAREALAGDPHNAFATIVLASAEMAQGHCAQAIADYRAYAVLVPRSAEPHHRIAICYARLGDSDKALAEEDTAMAIDPRDPDVRNHRGGLLAARGRVDEAIAELRAAVDIAPDSAVFHVGLARVLLMSGRLDEADIELRQALRRAPDNPDAHAVYGALLVARKQPDAAIVEFQRSLAMRPEADDVRLDLATALERAGRQAEARREYQRLASGRDTPPDIRQAARAHLR